MEISFTVMTWLLLLCLSALLAVYLLLESVMRADTPGSDRWRSNSEHAKGNWNWEFNRAVRRVRGQNGGWSDDDESAGLPVEDSWHLDFEPPFDVF